MAMKFVASLKEFLPQVRDIFGLKIFASSTVPVEKLNHAATILYEYLDNDENGIVDNPLIHDALLSMNGGMIMHRTSDEFDEMYPRYEHITNKFNFNFSRLYDEETRPGGSKNVLGSDEFDGSLEEILHMITKQGYGYAYPKIFGLAEYALKEGNDTSKLSSAARIARGGIEDDVRDDYPENAWYRRFDNGCQWECIATEYIYWGLTSLIGANQYTGRGEKIFDEWELNTPKKFKSRDKALYALLVNDAYAFPKDLPDGDYSPFSVLSQTVKNAFDREVGSDRGETFKGRRSPMHFKGKGGNDKLIGSKKDDILDGGDDNDVLIGRKGADTYVLSPGEDKFNRFSVKEGDNIHIDHDISYKLVQSKEDTLIQHDDGVTTVHRVQKDELAGVIEIVYWQ